MEHTATKAAVKAKAPAASQRGRTRRSSEETKRARKSGQPPRDTEQDREERQKEEGQ
jgi:hypothetical protein